MVRALGTEAAGGDSPHLCIDQTGRFLGRFPVAVAHAVQQHGQRRRRRPPADCLRRECFAQHVSTFHVSTPCRQPILAGFVLRSPIPEIASFPPYVSRYIPPRTAPSAERRRILRAISKSGKPPNS